jgi:RNA-directed DNA polymerase
MLTLANVVWGARCGESARRVLLGETRSSGHAYSVRGARESAALRQAPHRLPSSRLVSTNPFDLWVDVWRKKWAQGDVVVVRYADDIILGFQHQTEADRFLENFRDRLGTFGLELHPDKTRRIEFGRFAEQNRKRRGEGKPETFDFLGFTHISGKNGLGRFMVRRTTIRKRMRAKLRQVKQQLRERMHDPVPQTGQWLKSVVQGYFNYYAVPGNLASLGVFRDQVLALWWRTIRRRSQQRRISWTRILVLAQRWFPQPRALHPFPDARFAASHPR